jgi:hypothetical protein
LFRRRPFPIDRLVSQQFRRGVRTVTTKQQIDSFSEFATSQMDTCGAERSMDELYLLWRAKHPTPAELAESVAALQAAYGELEAGDSGRPARAALRESCERLGLVIS